MRAVITVVIAVLFVACQVLSGPAHAVGGAAHAHGPHAVGDVEMLGAHDAGHDHAIEMPADATTDRHSHSHSEPGTCDAVCHGIINVGRAGSATFAILAARLLPEGEGIGASIARDRIDRPPSLTAVN